MKLHWGNLYEVTMTGLRPFSEIRKEVITVVPVVAVSVTEASEKALAFDPINHHGVEVWEVVAIKRIIEKVYW